MSTRSALIRVAASMPQGTPERRVLLQRAASIRVTVDISKYVRQLDAIIDDYYNYAFRRDIDNPPDRKEYDRSRDRLLRETQSNMDRIANNIREVIAKIPNWYGTPVTVAAGFNDNLLDFDIESGSTWANITVGREATFAYSLDAGDRVIVDDILEAGDSDFFRDVNLEQDYFNLIDGIRRPGRSNRYLTLWTARPKKDAPLFDGATTIPSRIFLSSSVSDAEGIGSDFGGRDIYKVVIQEQYVMKTLDLPAVKHYQTIVTPNGHVPVRSVDLQ